MPDGTPSNPPSDPTLNAPANPPADPPASDPPAADPPAAPVKNAPETYEFKAPEGQSFNEQVLAAYTTAAKELDLTQDAAQKILDSVAPVMAAQQSEAIAAVKAGWVEASKNDAEFGGEKFDENLAIAKKGLESFATPEFVEFLNTSGLGDHPEVLRTFLRIGKAIGEDSKIVTGGPTKDAPRTLAQRMYPDMNP